MGDLIIVPDESWRKAVVDLALVQDGYAENPRGSNKTKYGAWYGKAAGEMWNGQKWCGMFVSWVFCHAGFALPEMQAPRFSGFAKAHIGFSYCLKHGWITDIPKPGNLVFYDFDQDGQMDHCGILTADQMRHVEVVEGNTGHPPDGVLLMRRPKTRQMFFATPVFP